MSSFLCKWFGIGCPKPPPPPLPPQPVVWNLGITIEPSDCQVELTVDDGTTWTGTVIGGRAGIKLVAPPAHPGYGGVLTVSKDGYLPSVSRVNVGTGDAELPNVILQPARIDLPRLVVRGRYFGLATGARWTGVGCSDFPLYVRFLNHEDIEPILAERAACGFNFLRVWLLNTSVYRIVPSDWGDAFYTELPAFCQLCAKYGLYVQFTALTQCLSLMPDSADQQAHLDRIAAALAGETNWFGEGCNEFNNADNRMSESVRKPAGLWARASQAGDPGDTPPMRPAWDYECIHSFSASGEWQRVVGKQASEASDQTGLPTIANENCRFMDNDSSLIHASDAAAGAALLSAGAVFHSWRGKLSQPFTETLEAAKAWASGARNVPLEFQDGNYVHRADLETPDLLRVYGKRLPDGREFDVSIRR